jgi:hypothetical protein
MNHFLRSILISTIILITASGQTAAMSTQPEKAQAKRTSCCNKLMSWIMSFCVETEKFPKHVRALSRTVFGVEQHFKKSSAEKGAVIVCNIDSMLQDNPYTPLRAALVTLVPFFAKKGYAIVLITTTPEKNRDTVITKLMDMGYGTDTFTIVCMPTATYDAVVKLSDAQQIAVIVEFLEEVRMQLIKNGNPVAASIDTERAYLEGSNVGHPILITS